MSGKDLFVGLDLGGNHVKVGLGCGSTDQTLFDAAFPSRASEGREGLYDALCEAVAAALAAAPQDRVRGIGLGSPGVVDPQGRVRYEVANLPGWQGADVPALFRERFGLPTAVDNDANMAAFAEAILGAGRGIQHVLMITLGTGIGGGYVVDGELLHGEHGAAMELGHIPIASDGESPQCGCGMRGCVESLAGGRALLRDFVASLDDRDCDEYRGVRRQELTLRDIIEGAAAGDAQAVRALEGAAEHVALALVGALHLLNPGVLVIGGGVVDGCPWMVQRIEDGLRQRVLPKAFAELTVARAGFGNRAGVLGALALARSVAMASRTVASE